MAWAAVLMRTSLPPLENILFCQFKILFNTLSFTSLKKLGFFRPIIEGRPKYFSCLETTLRLKIPLIADICPSGILPVKNIEDLSKLKIYPEAFM